MRTYADYLPYIQKKGACWFWGIEGTQETILTVYPTVHWVVIGQICDIKEDPLHPSPPIIKGLEMEIWLA